MIYHIFRVMATLSSLTLMVGCSTLANQSNLENDYLNSAKINLSNHNALQALESANQAILLAPNKFNGYYLAAQSYQMLQDNANASINYAKFFELNKNFVNIDDFGLSYANFLCLVQHDYVRSDYFYNKSFLTVPKQNVIMLSKIYTAYADCLSLQNKDDEAINSYISAMSQQEAPINAYLGISKIYIKEHNYGKAYYYINLYSGKATTDLLKIKILALAGLLSSDKSLKDYEKLSDLLRAYQQQLLALSNTTPVTPIPSSAITNKMPPTTLSNSVKTPSEIQGNLSPDKKINISQTGRKYIVVKPRDTLYSLSKETNVPLSRLIQINKIRNNKIELGEVLYLE